MSSVLISISSSPPSLGSTSGESWLDSVMHSSLPTPALTSTMLKQTRAQKASKKPQATESNVGSALTEPESEDEFSSGYTVFYNLSAILTVHMRGLK